MLHLVAASVGSVLVALAVAWEELIISFILEEEEVRRPQ